MMLDAYSLRARVKWYRSYVAAMKNAYHIAYHIRRSSTCARSALAAPHDPCAVGQPARPITALAAGRPREVEPRAALTSAAVYRGRRHRDSGRPTAGAGGGPAPGRAP